MQRTTDHSADAAAKAAKVAISKTAEEDAVADCVEAQEEARKRVEHDEIERIRVAAQVQQRKKMEETDVEAFRAAEANKVTKAAVVSHCLYMSTDTCMH